MFTDIIVKNGSQMKEQTHNTCMWKGFFIELRCCVG